MEAIDCVCRPDHRLGQAPVDSFPTPPACNMFRKHMVPDRAQEAQPSTSLHTCTLVRHRQARQAFVLSCRCLRGVCALSIAVPEFGAPKAAITFDGCAPTVPDELAAEGVIEVAASAAPAQGVDPMADERSDPRSRFRCGSQACGRGWSGTSRCMDRCAGIQWGALALPLRGVMSEVSSHSDMPSHGPLRSYACFAIS
jgi:hypothetical protein